MRGLHELQPDRQRGAATGDFIAERREVIATDPHAADALGGGAHEPDITETGGGSGFAGDGTAKGLRRAASTALDHRGHEIEHDVGKLLTHDPFAGSAPAVVI